MALIKKQLLAKEDMLLSADNTPVSQARAGTIISVHPVNASVIPFDETKSIVEAVEDLAYTHPSKHPVSIIDGSSNPSKFVKTDTLGNTGFDGVAWADIEGKPGTYTPSSHEHSLDEVTSGSLAASRIIVSETRQFITAEQATQLLEMEVKSNKGIPNGYAPLDSNGKINSSFLSDLNLVDVFTPINLASMLALTSAQPGDIAYRQDNSTSYMLVALPSSTEANWKSLNTGSQIISVNGQTGIVSLNTSNIAESTNLYFTNERVDDRVAALLQAGTNITLTYNDALNTLTISANDTSVNWSEIQSTPTTVSGYGITDVYTKTESNAALSLKAPLASPALTGTPTAPTAAMGTNTTQLATTAFVWAEIANGTYSKADVDAMVVHKTGNETISGTKTFRSSPVVPNATTATQAVNKEQLDTKQDTLVSGTNIKTINSTSLLGSGNISVVSLTGDETISGTKTFSNTIIGNISGTSTKLTSSQGDWSASGVIGNVVGMLSWKNYGNGHVIFDASNGTAPNGAAVNNTNSASPWSPSFPTLMGWNGGTTFGVRVDSARVADTAGNAIGYNQTWQDVTASRALGTTYTNSTSKPIMLVVNASRGANSTSMLFISINGGTAFRFAANSNSGGGNYCSGSVIIPVGQTYAVTSSDSALTSWLELR